MPEMPRYVCHKIVHALKLEGFNAKMAAGMPVLLIPADKRFAPIEVTQEWAREKKIAETDDPGYYVAYEDGYTSWSPTEAFEKGYTLLGSPDSNVNPLYVPKLSAASPWVTILQTLVDAIRSGAITNADAVMAATEAAEALLRDGVALTVTPTDPLETALIDVTNAKDGAGRFVRLLPSTNYSAIELRRVTNEFMKIDFETVEFFGRDSSEKTRSMAAWYRNLALLARATAAAIERESRAD